MRYVPLFLSISGFVLGQQQGGLAQSDVAVPKNTLGLPKQPRQNGPSLGATPKGSLSGGFGPKGPAKGRPAPKAPGQPVVSKSASGPYKAAYWQDPGLPKHTIYAPFNPPAGLKIPVMVWGNGACSSSGLLFSQSLNEVASHGIFVIANGSPNGGKGQTNYQYQMQAIDWIYKNAGKGKYANVVKERIAAGGQSCGGLETYRVGVDRRVSTIGIFNSGEFTQAATAKTARAITKPIFYFLGGPSDIAYANGERDYKALRNVPRWKGNQNVGHLATWMRKNGGSFGRAETLWLQWMLRGNTTARRFFAEGGAKAEGWDAVSADLDKVPRILPL